MVIYESITTGNLKAESYARACVCACVCVRVRVCVCGGRNGIMDNGVDHYTTLDGTRDADLYKVEYF
jgi:hypothetical protein